MSLDVAEIVGPAGWASWEELTARVDHRTVARWVTAGTLVRAHAGVYVLAARANDWRLRVAAAVRSCRGVVSHGSALALWGLAPPELPVHVSVEFGRSGRGSDGVVLHRTRDLVDSIRRVGGLPTSAPERAVVDVWGSLPRGADRSQVRAAAIGAVGDRRCGPRELRYELGRRPRLPGRQELVTLVDLLADGCRSELEIWGCLNVLRAPGMPAFTQQRRVRVGGRTFALDACYEEVLLVVEMDGAAFHGSREQREHDIRRDALLATLGWLVLRFSYRRLTEEPEACRREILAVYRARQRLLAPDRVR